MPKTTDNYSVEIAFRDPGDYNNTAPEAVQSLASQQTLKRGPSRSISQIQARIQDRIDPNAAAADSNNPPYSIKHQLELEALQHMLFWADAFYYDAIINHNGQDDSEFSNQALKILIQNQFDQLKESIGTKSSSFTTTSQADDYRKEIYKIARRNAKIIVMAMLQDGNNAPEDGNHVPEIDAKSQKIAEMTSSPVPVIYTTKRDSNECEITITPNPQCKSAHNKYTKLEAYAATTMVTETYTVAEGSTQNDPTHNSLRTSYISNQEQIEKNINKLNPRTEPPAGPAAETPEETPEETPGKTYYYNCLMSTYNKGVGELYNRYFANQQNEKILQAIQSCHKYNQAHNSRDDNVIFPITLGVNGHGSGLKPRTLPPGRSKATQEARAMTDLGILSVLAENLDKISIKSDFDTCKSNFNTCKLHYSNFSRTIPANGHNLFHQSIEYKKSKELIKATKRYLRENTYSNRSNPGGLKQIAAQALVKIYAHDLHYKRENALLVQSLLCYLQPNNSTMLGCKSGNERMALVLGRAMYLRGIENQVYTQDDNKLERVLQQIGSCDQQNLQRNISECAEQLAMGHKQYTQTPANTISSADNGAAPGLTTNGYSYIRDTVQLDSNSVNTRAPKQKPIGIKSKIAKEEQAHKIKKEFPDIEDNRKEIFLKKPLRPLLSMLTAGASGAALAITGTAIISATGIGLIAVAVAAAFISIWSLELQPRRRAYRSKKRRLEVESELTHKTSELKTQAQNQKNEIVNTLKQLSNPDFALNTNQSNIGPLQHHGLIKDSAQSLETSQLIKVYNNLHLLKAKPTAPESQQSNYIDKAINKVKQAIIEKIKSEKKPLFLENQGQWSDEEKQFFISEQKITSGGMANIYPATDGRDLYINKQPGRGETHTPSHEIALRNGSSTLKDILGLDLEACSKLETVLSNKENSSLKTIITGLDSTCTIPEVCMTWPFNENKLETLCANILNKELMPEGDDNYELAMAIQTKVTEYIKSNGSSFGYEANILKHTLPAEDQLKIHLTENKSSLIMPYYFGQSLDVFLDSNPNLDTDSKKSLLKNIGDTIVQLHHNELVHGDLHAKNVIVQQINPDKYEAIIIDPLPRNQKTAYHALAPANGCSDIEVDKKSDIYGFGVIATLIYPEIMKANQDIIEAEKKDRPADIKVCMQQLGLSIDNSSRASTGVSSATSIFTPAAAAAEAKAAAAAAEAKAAAAAAEAKAAAAAAPAAAPATATI